MVYSITGTLATKKVNFVVLEAAGLGLKISTTQRTLDSLPSIGGTVKLFCHLRVKEDSMDLYGFDSEEELRFFELLISVNGVGPRSALGILGIGDLNDLAAGIKEGRPDLLTRASGIGRRTAERIIVELKTKVQAEKSEAMVKKMESDIDLIEALVGLGYRRDQVKAALEKIDKDSTGLEERLKAALKILGGKD